jgi:hypothetical protein
MCGTSGFGAKGVIHGSGRRRYAETLEDLVSRAGRFLSEAALEKPKTLERLNELFTVWLSECY